MSSGRVTVAVPAGATNGHLTITTPSGTSLPSPGAFQVVPTLSATSGKVGDTLTISGPKLDDIADRSASAARLRVSAVVDSPSQIHVTIPTAAKTGRVTVTTASSGLTPYTSDEIFTITPTITLVTPSSATAGSPVMIQGTGFSGLSSVKFNGIPATFSGVTPTTIRTHVPANATTGKIEVATVGGTVLSGSNFGVKPTVTSFLPTRGTVGSAVTITGSGFSGDADGRVQRQPVGLRHGALGDLAARDRARRRDEREDPRHDRPTAPR